MPEARLRSLRTSAFVAVLAVVVSPLVFVMVSGWVEGYFARRTLSRTVAAADAVAAALVRVDDETGHLGACREAIDAIARDGFQRLRVLDSDGAVLIAADYIASDRLLFQIGDLLYGPARPRVLATFDVAEGPLSERPEVREALAVGAGSRCEETPTGNLYVCHAARRVDLPGQGKLVAHAQAFSRRAPSLYDSRRQLFRLTLFMLPLGILLSWWMGRRMVRPVEVLSAEVLARAAAAVPRANLAMPRQDGVGDLALAFNTLLMALSDRTRANEAFLADLAHEFKNPVAAVRACAEQLADRSVVDEARAKRLGAALHRSAGHLDALVTQLLELARAEAGLPDEARETVDVAELLRGLADAESHDEARARVEVVLQDGALKVEGVRHRLESALRNLLDNALSFAKEDGWVRVEATRDETYVEVTIADSGPGIAPADLPRIFDRFFTTRGDQKGQKGSGLGLALTRAVVEAHGGRIRAESPAGTGARFVVSLPFTKNSSASHRRFIGG